MKTILKNIIGIALLSILAVGCSKPQNTTLKMLVGTYTEGNDSKGVYLYSLDTEKLEWELLDTAFVGNPSFVIPSDDRHFAYAVSEYSDGRQGVYSFTLTEHSIEVLNFRSGTGADPCNIVAAGGNIITSDYSGGTISVFPVCDDGSIDTIACRFVPGQDVISHIHCSAVSPDGKYVFTTDLGADNIYRATLPADACDATSSADVCGLPYDFCTAYSFDREMHPGPRHLTFSNDGRFAYLISELGDYISTFEYSNGQLKHLSTEKAYDGDGCGSADIHVSPDDRFVYTSHRLKEDGIAVFRRDPVSGLLARAGYCPTGVHPRNFAITPDGSLLLCACRDDNRIEIYSIDSETGALTYTGKSIELPAPVCIQLF